MKIEEEEGGKEKHNKERKLDAGLCNGYLLLDRKKTRGVRLSNDGGSEDGSESESRNGVLDRSRGRGSGRGRCSRSRGGLSSRRHHRSRGSTSRRRGRGNLRRNGGGQRGLLGSERGRRR